MQPLQAEDPARLGRYRVAARLGAGGMGTVYLGFSPAGRAVAVKVVHPELARDQVFVERFWREVAAARQVGGAYTAAVVDAGTEGGRPWLATVFVPGPSLGEAVAACGPLCAAAAWRLAGGLAEALSAVHACGLVHRDLTPANVLLAADGPRVIDFGLSRGLGGAVLTAEGVVFGTPGYMSPEQARGGLVGPASDVFALGCVLAFAATGIDPFGRGDPATVLYRVVHAPADLAGMAGPLRALAERCLAKEPARRPGVARLTEIIAAGITPDPAASPAAFWPTALDELIRSRQDRLGDRVPSVALGAPKAEAPADLTDGAPAVLEGHRGAGPVPAAAGPSGSSESARHRKPAATRRGLLLGFAGVAAAGVAGAWELGRPVAARQPRAGAVPSRPPGPGTRIWSFAAGGSAGSPAVAGGRVFAASAGNAIYGLRASDGTLIWKYPTGRPNTAGPAVSGGVVYAASYDGNLYALAAGSGTEQWSYAAGAPLYGTPAVAGNFVYVGREGVMVQLARFAGVAVWARPVSGNVYYAPSVAGGAVYLGASGGQVYALRVADGSTLWEQRVAGPLLGPVRAGGAVYTGCYDGSVLALRASDGTVIWRHVTGGHVTGAVAAGGVVYAGNTDGSVYALRVGDGTRIWQRPTGAAVIFAPAVAGGTVYAGNEAGHVLALRAADGARIWSYPTGGPVRSTPVVAAGVVYTGSTDGHIYAIRA